MSTKPEQSETESQGTFQARCSEFFRLPLPIIESFLDRFSCLEKFSLGVGIGVTLNGALGMGSIGVILGVLGISGVIANHFGFLDSYKSKPEGEAPPASDLLSVPEAVNSEVEPEGEDMLAVERLPEIDKTVSVPQKELHLDEKLEQSIQQGAADQQSGDRVTDDTDGEAKISPLEGDSVAGDSAVLTQKINHPDAQPYHGERSTSVRSRTELVREVFFRHREEIIQHASVSGGDAIPKKKLNSAKAYGEYRDDEEILFLYDSTVFGSAKQGIVWTTHAIHGIQEDNTQFTVPFEQVEDLRFSDHGLSSTLVVNDEFEIKFIVNFSNLEPFLLDFQIDCLGDIESHQDFSAEERELYLDIYEVTPDWTADEKRRMVKNISIWEQEQPSLINQMQDRFTQSICFSIGAVFPQVDDLIEDNLDPEEEIKFKMAGLGLHTLFFTNKSVVLVREQIDHEMSDDGTHGEIKGAMAGQMGGAGVGYLLGSSFGLTGMVVGGLLGGAGGTLAGAEAGSNLSRNIVNSVQPIFLRYPSIKRIVSGHKQIGSDQIPMMVFTSSDYPEPIEFHYDPVIKEYASQILAFMKKAVAEAADDVDVPKIATKTDSDVLTRLKSLKEMLDLELIDAQEFEQKKQEILRDC